jgi:hypothetical protein
VGFEEVSGKVVVTVVMMIMIMGIGREEGRERFDWTEWRGRRGSDLAGRGD